MTYKLVATDLDGTLVGRDLAISPRTLKAVQGVHFVMATGRMFRSTLPYARQCEVLTPLITYQGALIRDHRTMEDLWHRTLEAELAAEALEALAETGLHVNVYVNDEMLVEKLTPQSELYSRISLVEPRVVSSFLDPQLGQPTKIVAIGDPAQIDHWVPQLQRRFGSRLYVTKSIPPFLEIASPRVSKSQALAHLAERFGIRREEVIAFGDGMNDLDMLEWAGCGVAMGNAAEVVQATADRVAAPITEDGVARILEELY
jgi:Cof subfamily protein (haloacid dehalogenase superfamily)